MVPKERARRVADRLLSPELFSGWGVLFAPARLLALVRPRLPAGVDWVVLRRLRIGEAKVSLRFERRKNGDARVTVLERHGSLRIVRSPPPIDLSPERRRPGDGLRMWLLERLPGRTARVLRIALGLEPGEP